jgi:hypothetical protein
MWLEGETMVKISALIAGVGILAFLLIISLKAIRDQK